MPDMPLISTRMIGRVVLQHQSLWRSGRLAVAAYRSELQLWERPELPVARPYAAAGLLVNGRDRTYFEPPGAGPTGTAHLIKYYYRAGPDHRRGLKAARISVLKNWGSSQAAKCPPLSTLE